MPRIEDDHRVTCVLPAYNEAGSLADTVARWAAALPTFTPEHEIIVVDDGSTDDSAPLLRQLCARYPSLRVLTHATNLGYGAAIAYAFRQAAFPLLFFTDSDGQYEPDDLPLLLARIATADVVVGYRLRRADPPFRSLLSRGYNLLARRLIGVSLRDLNCAFKLMHRETFRRLDIQSTGFIVNAELAARACDAGMTVVEVGVRHRPRHAGRSTVRPHHVLAALVGLARVRARRRPPRDRSAAPARVVGAGAASLGLEPTPSPRRPVG
jgi:dolichol-phosphate mannosyltransferase